MNSIIQRIYVRFVYPNLDALLASFTKLLVQLDTVIDQNSVQIEESLRAEHEERQRREALIGQTSRAINVRRNIATLIKE